MRTAWYGVAAVVFAATGCGCIARHPLTEGELDRAWSLHPVRWDRAEAVSLEMEGRPLPTRWVIRQNPSLIRSTISLVRASDRLKTGAQAIAFSLSPEHAEMAASMLADARRAIVDFREVVDAASPPTRERWAAAAAGAIAEAESIVRLGTVEDVERMSTGGDEPLGLSTEPLMTMAIAYLNERIGGNLLAGMDVQDAGRLREALAQTVLRLAFGAAGKRDPPGLRQTVAHAMREASEPDALRRTLPPILLAHFETASPGGGVSSVARTAFALAPRMLRVLEMVVKQWDRMDGLEVEFREGGGEPIVAMTLNVTPGREVRIADLFILQPAVVIRGQIRILVDPDPAETGDVAVLFEPVPDAEGTPGQGATEVRFEGLAYALVRLLALPLDSAALREIRVSAATEQNRSLLSVVMLMEATGDSGDGRRLMAFQNVREKCLIREPFRVRNETERLEQIFNYMTPKGRYTYRREKTPAGR